MICEELSNIKTLDCFLGFCLLTMMQKDRFPTNQVPFHNFMKHIGLYIYYLLFHDKNRHCNLYI